MVEQTTQDGINYGTKFKICSITLLYPKEEQISMISIKL